MAHGTARQRRRDQGERLKRLRERLDVQKSEIAVRMGWQTTQTYDLYERGTSTIRLDVLHTWATAFGITPEQFAAVILGTRSLEDAVPDPGAILRERLHSHVPADEIERQVRDHGDRDARSQHAVAEAVLHATDAAIESSRRRSRPA